MTIFSGGQTQDERLAGLSGPGDVSNDNLSRRIKLITDSAPLFGQGDGIKFAHQLASSNFSDEEIRNQAMTTASALMIDSYKSHLTGIQDHWKQLQAWKQFDEGTQRLLKKSGYLPPTDAVEPEMTEFGIVKKIAGDFVHDTTHFIGIKQALGALDYVGSIGTHLYRAARLGAEEEGVFGIGGSLSDAEIQEKRGTPAAVARDFRSLWDRTEKGEYNYTNKAQDRVRATMEGDADKFGFVKALADGKSISDYLIKDLKITPDTPYFEQQLMKYSQYQGQDQVQEAVKDLRNNRVSPGRDTASLFHLKRGTAPFNVISGGIDATFRVLTDPTLIGGEMAQSARVARYGLEAGTVAGAAEGLAVDAAELTQKVDKLSQIPRFQKAADTIADGLKTGRIGELLDRVPALRGGGLHDMAEYFATKGQSLEDLNREHIFDYFKSTSGAQALNESKFAAPHFPGTTLPMMTKGQEFRSGAVLGIKDWVSQFRLEDFGFDSLEPGQLAELFNVRQRAAINLRGAVGDAIHSMYTLIPKYDYMGPDDSHSLGQFRAVLEYSLPGHLRDDYLNEYLQTTSVAARRNIYEAGIQSMFHYSGALQTEQGKNLMAKVLGRYQNYAAEGLDVLGDRPVGIGESDLAEYWGIPDFKEMLKATSESTFLRKHLDGMNEGMINSFMSKYWKPAVLLKAGFIPRAYGEEFLGFMLREGPSAWLKGQAAITAEKTGYILPMRPVGWIADSMLSHIPLISKAAPLDIYAHNLADSVSMFTRNWAKKLAPEEYIAAIRSAGMYGGGVDGAVAQLGTSLGDVATPVGERLKNETIGRLDPATKDITYLPVVHGEITTHIKGPAMSGFYPHTVLREMRRMQTDRLYVGMIDAGRRQLAEGEAEHIIGAFEDFLPKSETGEPLSATPIQRLRHLRELVPDKVMPNYERWLRNDSHASIQSVLDDLTGAGMELEDARAFRNSLEMLDTRQRVAVFTRDGEIEKIYRPHILDPDAAFNTDSDLPQIRQRVENEALKEYNEVLETLWGPEHSGDAYWKISRRRLNSADMQETVRKSYRSQRTLDNRTVASPPVKGTRRVYTVVMDKDPVSAFEDMGYESATNSARTGSKMPQLARTNDVIDVDNGYIPFQSSEINSMSPGHVPNTQLLSDLPEGEALTPEEMAWFTQDYSHAEDVHNGLKAKYKGQNVSIGYVDVPEDVFQEGQRLAKANVHGGLDSMAQANAANQVWVPKSWREKYQVLGEDNFRIIPGKLSQEEVDALRQEATGIKDQLSAHESDLRAKSQREGMYEVADSQATWNEQQLAKAQETGDQGTVFAYGRKKYKGNWVTEKDWVTQEEARATAEYNRQVIAQRDPSAITPREALDEGYAKAREMKQRLNSLYDQISTDGPQVAVGAAQHEAINDWAYVLQRRYQQVFESKNNHALRDLQHKLLENRINVRDVFDQAPNLSDTAIGASILEPSRENWFKNLITKGFDAIGAGGNAMIRNQMYLHYYAQRLSRETDVMMRLLGAEGTPEKVKAYADRLGVSHYQLASDWKSLPKEIQNSVNPIEAMIARDPVPPSLRSVVDVADQKQFAEAFTAWYEHGNADLIPEAEKLWNDKYIKKLGTEGYSFRDIQDSYISLDPELRESIRNNGYPPQMPHSFTSRTRTISEELPAEVDLERAAKEARYQSLKSDIDELNDEHIRALSTSDIMDDEGNIDLGTIPRHPDLIEAELAPLRREHNALWKELQAMPKPVAKTIEREIEVGGASLSADEWTELRDVLNRNGEVYRNAHLKAMKGAIEDTIPWIDDHRVRSQFQQHGRNLIPFWFAQENFMKRTLNNVLRDPVAIRKLQLGMDALHNSGVVTQNQFGEDVFNIPFTGAMTSAVTKSLEKITGGRFKVSIPVVSPMTGQLKYTIPGLDTLDRIGPSVSPMIGLPLDAITKIFPELDTAKQMLTGDRAVADSNGFDLILKSLMPSWASKMYESFAKDVSSDSEYASAMIQTAQTLQVKTDEILQEAKGLDPVRDAEKIKEIRARAGKYGLLEDADEYTEKEYRHRLENFTRMQMFLRGAVGFFSPASPSTAPVDEFTPEFNKLLHEEGLPLDQAFTEFMTRHPEARAYTIVKTDVPSKAPLSSSEEAGIMLEKNKEYFEKYDKAGPWLLPQSNDDTGFSYRTYNDEIAMELRKRKSVKDWYDDYFFAAAADTYFNSKDTYELKMAAAKGNPQLRRAMTDSYQTWKDQYLSEHKIFAKKLNDPESQQHRREVIDQMDAALNDPARPQAEHAGALGTLTSSYKNYLSQKDQFKRNTNAERQIRQSLTDSFTMWVHQYVDKNPNIKAFYNRIIRPELGVDE